MAALPDPVAQVEEAVDRTSFDPAPPPRPAAPRRWWGNHLAELRWQAELARLLVDPVFRGAGVGMIANVDCSDRAADRLERRLLALHARTGRRVALVGHSRGGHFAKAL